MQQQINLTCKFALEYLATTEALSKTTCRSVPNRHSAAAVSDSRPVSSQFWCWDNLVLTRWTASPLYTEPHEQGI